MDTIRAFFPKSAHIFFDFHKREGQANLPAPPPHPSHVVARLKWSFPLRILLVNVTKSEVSCGSLMEEFAEERGSYHQVPVG